MGWKGGQHLLSVSLCSIDIMRKASGARQGAWAFLGLDVTPLQRLPACLSLLHTHF